MNINNNNSNYFQSQRSSGSGSGSGLYSGRLTWSIILVLMGIFLCDDCAIIPPFMSATPLSSTPSIENPALFRFFPRQKYSSSFNVKQIKNRIQE